MGRSGNATFSEACSNLIMRAFGAGTSPEEALAGQPFLPNASWIRYPLQQTMERTRHADRSQLIRFSAVVFALLALTSFLLAKVAA